jgi:hypothetical protein
MFQLLLRREKKEMSGNEALLFSTGGGFLCGALAGGLQTVDKILLG